jgi:chitinase
MKTTIALLTIASALTTTAFAGNTTSTRHFSPYADLTLNVHWDSHYQDLEPIDLTEISRASGINSYHLAFITDAGVCNPAWGGQSSYSTSAGWGSHLTDKLRANNINHIISFGGASGNDLSKACDTTQLAKVYEQVITTYQPQGLDFDIENDTANVTTVMHALQQIQKNHPNLTISFTLPVMPEGLTSSGQDIVKQAKTANLIYSVNIMAMDYGPAYANDMGQYAIQAATNLWTFLQSLYPQQSDAALWQMVEVTPMIGVNDVSIEQFSLANVDTLRNFARQKNMGGLSLWSVNRDYSCADSWTNPICSGNNLQTAAYEFSRRFMQ